MGADLTVTWVDVPHRVIDGAKAPVSKEEAMPVLTSRINALDFNALVQIFEDATGDSVPDPAELSW